MRRAFLSTIVSVCAVLLTVQAQQPQTVLQGVYAENQARRGQTIYKAQCALCHGEMLEGRLGPPLTGELDARLSTAAVRQCHPVDQSVELAVQPGRQPGRAGEHRTRAVVKPGRRGRGSERCRQLRQTARPDRGRPPGAARPFPPRARTDRR